MKIYDVTQETEKEMPYTADQPFNSWSDDVPEVVDQPVYLTAHQIALRDGTDVPAPQTGLARQQRLAKMEQKIAGCADFVADVDRYVEYFKHLESPCVGDLVPKMMGRYLDTMRADAIAEGRRLRSELAILRRQG